ncbi:DEAD/DEAH box helicase family protein [Pygmaiobacter massiliensis]|uniref:DEAD/DEAH box helicase family protein n=1 Tax=Pygmaiobacter massiliensis TaxID=1917873 RepID=UPI0028988158|nr:DEAD/DEAH box helicase family protein [Pygmaiobacter massiliensis]
MKTITIKTAQRVIPMIYAYTTPEIHKHDGWTKIGYTEQDVDKRLSQQTHTADVDYHEEWRGNATFDDGSGERFTDKDFHAYLRKLGVENNRANEWFHINGPDSRAHFNDFRANRGILKKLDTVIPYTLRKEQAEAVEKTKDYAALHEQGEFLWNAKPRFGKTLSAYEFCREVGARAVLILTNRPAIANSWYSDYEKFFGTESGYRFVSETDSLKGKPLVLTRKQYLDALNLPDAEYINGFIEFVSLQDLKGSLYFGGEFDKLQEVAKMQWDVVIIDEAHEGIDTYKSDVAFDHIQRKFTLHLSGTPFKALANDKFSDKAIFNWTYADEQKEKRDWNSPDGEPNPYATLPRLSLFTYQMSEIIRDELEQGIEIQGETEEYAFDLNEFFETKNGKFVHEQAVDRFLDALTTQTKFPFSTEELRNELKHTFWLLNRVDSARLLAEKLHKHPVFKDYQIVLAAGDGRQSEEEAITKSFDKVTAAIKQYDKTITLSVGQLTTGITVPEWTGVLMLSNIKSPELYMQAAFRAQNPCLFATGDGYLRKENAYVFDFDPARTLTIYEKVANDLSPNTTDGRGDVATRKENVRELLNFFPVIGEDEKGEMAELDAEKVLSIPHKIRSQEVVRRGFMSNYLFQNISNVFNAPPEVLDIIKTLTPVETPKADLTHQAVEDVTVDKNGDVTLDDAYVIGRTAEVFGEKIYEDVAEQFGDALANVDVQESAKDETLETLKELFQKQAVKPILETASAEIQSEMGVSDKKRLERKLKEDGDRLVGMAYGDYTIKRNTLEQQRKEELAQTPAHKQEEINRDFAQRQQQAAEELRQRLADSASTFVQTAANDVVRMVDTHKKEQEKNGIEEGIRDHLRGFSRTIPSFLMAYGNDTVTLDTFDTIIPGEVFKEVTSITLDQFRFLRDGGDYTDTATGEQRHFAGRLFDPVVFNDSVKEFLALRVRLADYFDETSKEDIFDYIPPQKTNQIFTPKWVVKKMVDMLEEENPGCFDSPDKTFIDMYMKSGMYITEIVKRLYQSNHLKQLYPDGTQRLRHIFEKQVYGLAPTEIIYKIATNYILGFDGGENITTHNFQQVDALKYAKVGTLAKKLDELYDTKETL